MAGRCEGRRLPPLTTFSRGLDAAALLGDDVAVPVEAVLRDAGEGGVVDVHEAEVVEQAPDEVPVHGDALGERAGDRVDAFRVADSAVVARDNLAGELRSDERAAGESVVPCEPAAANR